MNLSVPLYRVHFASCDRVRTWLCVLLVVISRQRTLFQQYVPLCALLEPCVRIHLDVLIVLRRIG